MKVGRRPESPWGYEPRSERIDALVDEAEHLADQIKPLLAGRPPAVQGTALVELVATWLAGHIDPTSEESTARQRADLFAHHAKTVERLVPVIAKGMGLPW